MGNVSRFMVTQPREHDPWERCVVGVKRESRMVFLVYLVYLVCLVELD
jgi:hypothetical protein